MALPGNHGILQWRPMITQPVEERETVAGSQQISPFTNTRTTVAETVNEESDISIRETLNSPLNGEDGAQLGATASATAASISSTMSSDDEVVVDMQHTRELGFLNVRQSGLSENDLSINVRVGRSSCKVVDDLVDLQNKEKVEEPLKKGFITIGNDTDVVELLKEMPSQRGVICREQQVLYCEDGVYKEGIQYKIIRGTLSKGAFGEAAMCQDLKTKKTFMRKTVKGKLSKNEIEVPIRFRGNIGIPEVYGVMIKDGITEIHQEFAGLSLKVLMESHYARQLCDPKMVMVLAFQAFATLRKMHSQGITHQDIKPENLCLDIQPNGVWRLKFIDFGSSQTPKDQVIDGLTNEYLSPESCNVILQIATEKLPRAAGRLGPGTDIWALTLSLLYCLCGYHVMVYVCTGQTKYVEQDPVKLQHLRMQCLIQICNLKDEDIMKKLICPSWPDALKVLLFNTLRVDPNIRWSAKDAAEFIQNWILKGSGAGVQQQSSPPPPTPAASSAVFRGLAPPKLDIQPRPLPHSSNPQVTETVYQKQSALPAGAGPPPSSPSLSPDSPSPAQLPDFTDLLSSDTTKKPQRRSRNKQRKEPYHQPTRRGSKN